MTLLLENKLKDARQSDYDRYVQLLVDIIPRYVENYFEDPSISILKDEMEVIWERISDDDRDRLNRFESAVKAEILKRSKMESKSCLKCNALCHRKNVVYGRGNPRAKLMFIGDSPSLSDDEVGIPFTGKTASLFFSIMQSYNISKDACYYTNIIKCRPINRVPYPMEIENCNSFLETEINCVNPRYIVCLGTNASQALLQTKATLDSLRQVLHSYGRSIVMCTYHPTYMLKNDVKRESEEDWAFITEEMKKNETKLLAF